MKTIFYTFSATLGLIALIGTLFLNTILGVFGLAATSVDVLQRLSASQRVVEQMQSRHQHKKLQAAKRLATKAPRRVASTALAAATIGTVAVVMTVTSLEVADYCEAKRVLQEDENLLYATAVEFDLEQCFEEGKEESKAILTELKNSSISAVSDAFSGTSEYSEEVWSAIRQAGLHGLYSGSAAVEAWWDDARRWLAE
ncbi:MAG: hypothetical protein V7629_07455 [Motiliproteus sp.]